MSVERSVVPEWLRGCWRRAWIEFADGIRDVDEVVHWLQTDSAMVDVRISGRRPSFVGARSLDGCTRAQLASIADANASTGFTSVTDVVDLVDGSHTCTAQWHTYGHGANFQPVCTYPEPGHLHVSAAGTVMIERAPSGAYVEEWHLVPGSSGALRRTDEAGQELFVAGPIAIAVRDRSVTLPEVSLTDLVADPSIARIDLEDALDCEFSVAEREIDSAYRIVVSTMPWREGEVLDVDV